MSVLFFYEMASSECHVMYNQLLNYRSATIMEFIPELVLCLTDVLFMNTMLIVNAQDIIMQPNLISPLKLALALNNICVRVTVKALMQRGSNDSRHLYYSYSHVR